MGGRTVEIGPCNRRLSRCLKMNVLRFKKSSVIEKVGVFRIVFKTIFLVSRADFISGTSRYNQTRLTRSQNA